MTDTLQGDYFTTKEDTHQGNSGNGSRINKPTIPTIQYNPPTDFVVGQYNNNIQPTQICTLFSNSDKIDY